jgi:hypothetical protein
MCPLVPPGAYRLHRTCGEARRRSQHRGGEGLRPIREAISPLVLRAVERLPIRQPATHHDRGIDPGRVMMHRPEPVHAGAHLGLKWRHQLREASTPIGPLPRIQGPHAAPLMAVLSGALDEGPAVHGAIPVEEFRIRPLEALALTHIVGVHAGRVGIRGPPRDDRPLTVRRRPRHPHAPHTQLCQRL